jgi:hypothetical protein
MSNRRSSYGFGAYRSETQDPVQHPEACPFCESKAVGTRDKAITISTYWRCQSCGEMWNPQRLERTTLPPRRGW